MLTRLFHWNYLFSVALLLYRGPTVGSLKIADLVLATALAFFILSEYDSINIHKKFYIILSIFFVSAYVSAVISPFRLSSGVAEDFLRLLFGFGFALMTFHFITTYQNSFEKLQHTFALAAILSSILGILAVVTFLLGFRWTWADLLLFDSYTPRAAPFSKDPNHYASVLTIAYILSYNNVFRFFTSNQASSIIWLSVPVILGTGIVATGSRTGVGVLIITTILLIGIPLIQLIACRQSSALFVITPTLVIIFATVVSRDWVGLLFNISPLRSGDVTSGLRNRIDLWLTAFRIWSDYPLFGVGLNNYLKYLTARTASKVTNPHNTYMTLLAQTGILGLGAILSVFISSTIIGVRALWDDQYNYALLGLVLIIAMAAWGVFLDILTSRRLWLALGVSLSLFQICSHKTNIKKL
jgi:O-antigen ligase